MPLEIHPVTLHQKDMEERYSRNRLYVSKEEQETIKGVRLLLAGAGMNSIIAECALRFGFECMTIIDGDKVDESCLDHQNFTKSDVGKYKAETLAKRLLKINPNANITFHNRFLDKDNSEEMIEGHDIAINTLGYDSDMPFVFDEICSKKNISVLHPYNFGWAGLLTIVKPGGYLLTEITPDYRDFELSMAKFVMRHFEFWNVQIDWLKDSIRKYSREKGSMPIPQLSIGSWLAASHCVNAMFNLVTKRHVRTFPKFYMSTILENPPMKVD